MPFDGKSGVRFDHDPDAVKRAFRESAGETIAALDHLAELFDGGKRWLRNKECDEKGRFCLRGGIAHIAAGDCVGYYLRAAIREFAGRSMSIPAYNDHAPNFAAIAYVISRARELASADAEDQACSSRTGNLRRQAQRNRDPCSYQIARRQDFCGAFWSARADNIRPLSPPKAAHSTSRAKVPLHE